MNKSLLVAALLAVALSACSKKEEAVATLPPPATPPALPAAAPAEAPPLTSLPAQDAAATPAPTGETSTAH